MDLPLHSDRGIKLFIRELHALGVTGEALLWSRALKSGKVISGKCSHTRFMHPDSPENHRQTGGWIPEQHT